MHVSRQARQCRGESWRLLTDHAGQLRCNVNLYTKGSLRYKWHVVRRSCDEEDVPSLLLSAGWRLSGSSELWPWNTSRRGEYSFSRWSGTPARLEKLEAVSLLRASSI